MTAQRTGLGTALLVALALCAFAANSVFGRLALGKTNIDPATFTVVRLLSGALSLALLNSVIRRHAPAGSWRGASALLAYAVAFSYAYVTLTAGTGALLLFFAVQTTMILWALLTGERMKLLQWAGLAMALAGFVLLVAPGVTAPDPIGAVLMIAAGIAWGIYSLLGRGAGDALAVTAGNFARALPMSLPLLALPALLPLPALNPDPAGLVWAVLSGALASGMGYAIWYAALPRLTATRAASLQLSVPVITSVGSVPLIGEPLTGHLVVSSVAILGGIALVIRDRGGRR